MTPTSLPALRCQVCRCTSGAVHAFCDMPASVRHRSLSECVSALLDELEAARAVLDTAMISGPPDATWRQLLVARAAWLAWQEAKR